MGFLFGPKHVEVYDLLTVSLEMRSRGTSRRLRKCLCVCVGTVFFLFFFIGVLLTFSLAGKQQKDLKWARWKFEILNYIVSSSIKTPPPCFHRFLWSSPRLRSPPGGGGG